MSTMRIDDIIAQTLALTDSVLRAHHTDPLDDEREDARRLLDACIEQQRDFAATHGRDEANPTSRAWYLLTMMLEHATLLRPDAAANEPSPADLSDSMLQRGAPMSAPTLAQLADLALTLSSGLLAARNAAERSAADSAALDAINRRALALWQELDRLAKSPPRHTDRSSNLRVRPAICEEAARALAKNEPDAEAWLIEFRSGSFFQRIDALTGGPKDTAETFRSKKEADDCIDKNLWIAVHGGMAVRA